eukprot:TCONS_00029670-protein
MAGSNDSVAIKLFTLSCSVVGWFWNTVTFIPWYVLSGNFKRPKYGHIQGKSITGRPEGPYADINHLSGSKDGFDGITTLDQLFKKSVEKHGDRGCMGTRELLAEDDEVQPNGRIFKKMILGDYKWMSYNEAYTEVQRVSAGLKAIGVQTKEYVIIFAETKAEWMLSAQACFMRNFPVVTIYATLGDDALVYGFNEAEAKYVMVDAALLPKLKNLISQLTHVEQIVYFGNAKKALVQEFPENIKVYSYQQIKDIGSKLKNFDSPVESPDQDDVAVVMYTSGSTGVPKGVIISHLNVTSCLHALVSSVPNMGPNDRYIGYLPLAHIMELACECGCLALATPIGYSSALTLSDQSSKIKKGTKGDASVLRPTLMAAVPMIMDRMRKAVLDKVAGGSPFAQALFNFAFNYKLRLIRKGYDTPILNKVVFKKVRAILGGELRMMLSGGAPLSPETEEFMNVCFCCPIGQGYGLTETCAGGTLCNAWDQSTGRVGRPIPCCQIKLESWDEGGYTVNDKPFPRGEIIIGGNHVTLGYLKQEAKTRESYKVQDGKRWFYTGDIGVVEDDGVIRIVDRKKDLVKLAHGEYISLGKVEAALKQSKYVDNCCAYGDSRETFIVLLVVPVQAAVEELTASLGASGAFEDHCSNKDVIAKVLQDIQAAGKGANLHKSELPAKIKLCVEPWTPENDLVTAAFKLKRKNIQRSYQADIDVLYAK